MSRNKIGYKTLIADDTFRDLNLAKVRWLLGLGLAEMLGTASFMAMGCGNVVSTVTGADTSHLSTVLSFAFGISTAIMMVGHISGAIMNPGLNITAVILGHMSIPKLLFYTFFQVLGAVMGVGLLKAVTPVLSDGFCVPQPHPEVGLIQAFVVEFLTTCVLAFVFCSVLDPRNANSAVTIYAKFGITITALAIPSAKYAGCSMNPARAFGPAFVMSHWNYHWVYWLAPCLASAFTGFLYRVFFDAEITDAVTKKSPPVENNSQPV